MKEILGRIVAAELEERRKQGYDVEALRPLLGKASGSCDALLALSQRIKEAPIRQDWPYEEPDDLESVMAACDPTRRREASRLLSDEEIEARVRSAFLRRLPTAASRTSAPPRRQAENGLCGIM